MAILIVDSSNIIEISLDGLTDFDITTDLIDLGLARNAPQGITITKIVFVPSAADDVVIVRDGENGPRIFTAVTLGTYDILKDDFRTTDERNKGKKYKPYIHFNEITIANPNQAYLSFYL